MPYSGYYGTANNVAGSLLTVLVLSIIAAVILAAVFLPKSKAGTYTGFTKSLYEFLNFTKFWLPALIKFIYLLVVCYAVIGGLYMMFTVDFFQGLLLMVLLPVLMRLLIEGVYILYSIRDELTRIRERLEEKDGQ